MPWQKLSNRQNPYISNPKNWPDYYCLAYETKDKTGKLCRAEFIEYFDLKKGGAVKAIILFLNYPDNTEESFIEDLEIRELTESKDFRYNYDKGKNAIIFDQCEYLDAKGILAYLAQEANVIPENFYKEVKEYWIERGSQKRARNEERNKEILSRRQAVEFDDVAFKQAQFLFNVTPAEGLECHRRLADGKNRDSARIYAIHTDNIREKLHYFELAVSLGDIHANNLLAKSREENIMLDLEECWANKPVVVTQEFLDQFKEKLAQAENLIQERLEMNESFNEENQLKVKDFFNQYYLILGHFLSMPNAEGTVHADQAFKAYSQVGKESIEAYVQAQLGLAMLVRLVCYYGSQPPENVDTKKAEDKKQRLEGMLPFLEEAATYGGEEAIESRDQCLSQVISIRAIEKAITSHCRLFSKSELNQNKSAFLPTL